MSAIVEAELKTAKSPRKVSTWPFVHTPAALVFLFMEDALRHPLRFQRPGVISDNRFTI